ncbi:hypothetical protein [Aliarcobacter butzleri]|uniref:FAD/FMN-containing dehydrogenase n=1 Tax=Aliarcobacter butzleri L355 TaxID=1447263 RepID=A0A0G9KQA1_9BACT|nr:hypothetical protein [Aliarcobacter butzleri]KLE08621.1 hypothetical protein AF80_08735 [Aliarcobacter butzleri L355]MDN5085870.1 hypothetical protein [Aliarcobacter butzleri]
MIKQLILSIIFVNSLFAVNLKIEDKISNFSLTDQFDKIHTISNDIKIIIVTFQKDTLLMVNNFLSSKSSDFLENHKAIVINDISSTPNIITKMFTLPKLRDYKYSILLIYDENNTKFTKQTGKITTYSLENGVIKDIRFLSSTYELEEFLK